MIKDCKEFDTGNTDYKCLQEFFSSILTRVGFLENYVVSYDLKDILMIREHYDSETVDRWLKLNPPKHHLLKDFKEILFPLFLAHQADTNTNCLKHHL